MSLSQIASIAARYLTHIADAMIAACIAKAIETGEKLEVPDRRQAQRPKQRRRTQADEEMTADEWRQLVEGNRESSAAHVNS